jgi:CarD family transcriptional regulator
MVGYKIGQKVVYPNHGIGVVEEICKHDSGNGETNLFYQMRLLATNSRVMVPVNNVIGVGLRPPISNSESDRLLKMLSDDFVEPVADWKDRHKIFLEKMQSGDIFEVAQVLKTLAYLNTVKPLSFREKRLFEKARFLVVSELSVVWRKPTEQVDPKIDMALEDACKKHYSRNGKTRAMAVAVR